jgi:oligopeptide/dipeptide ABC transporter ATP-binding protein
VPVLDVSVQASVLDLAADLQRDMGFSWLFITHDLSVVRFLADRIPVMYLGEIVETGPTSRLFTDPQHPYTLALLPAAPEPDSVRQRERRRVVLGGEVPRTLDSPSGCRFHTRCPLAVDTCRTETPRPHAVRTEDRPVACDLVTSVEVSHITGRRD